MWHTIPELPEQNQHHNSQSAGWHWNQKAEHKGVPTIQMWLTVNVQLNSLSSVTASMITTISSSFSMKLQAIFRSWPLWTSPVAIWIQRQTLVFAASELLPEIVKQNANVMKLTFWSFIFTTTIFFTTALCLFPLNWRWFRRSLYLLRLWGSFCRSHIRVITTILFWAWDPVEVPNTADMQLNLEYSQILTFKELEASYLTLDFYRGIITLQS